MKKIIYSITFYLMFIGIGLGIQTVTDFLVQIDGTGYSHVTSVETNLHVTLENFDSALDTLNSDLTNNYTLIPQNGSNTDSTVVTPRFVGDSYIATNIPGNTGKVFRSYGTTTNDWKEITGIDLS